MRKSNLIKGGEDAIAIYVVNEWRNATIVCFVFVKSVMIASYLMDELDEIDWHILAVLQEDGAIANTDLADRVGLSPAPCLRRVKRLKEEGIIKRTVVEMDYTKLGFSISAYVEVTLSLHTASTTREFLKRLHENALVISCQMMTGDCDFVLHIMAPDIAAYRHLVWEELHSIKGVQKLHSRIVLETTKSELGPALQPSGPGLKAAKRATLRR